MRNCIFIILIFLVATVYGQTKDRRAELGIDGRVNEISISPDEKIWLVTAIGNIYYTNDIDSNWHYGQSIFQSTNEFGLDRPHLERISFFNKDTAIMTGYISVNKDDNSKNGLYFTKDGGNSWTLLDYGGDSWIYDSFIDKNGNAWIGGSSGYIYYSKDFGQHWEKLNSPYNSNSRMHRIFMYNSHEGIAGALHNEIYTTSDNWKTNKKISTPFDQKKYINDDNYSDDRIEKILFWNNYIVVNQNGNIFYSEANKIDWKSFTVKVVDFELDNETKKIFAITDSLEIISFSTPEDFHLVSKKTILGFPIDIKVVNHSLYVISSEYEVYKINEKGYTHVIPYTIDKKIDEPRIVQKGKRLIWGIDGKQIYLAEDSNYDWFRENVLEFEVDDFMLLNDSIAILWDGVKNNYLYSLHNHTSKIYYPNSPIKSLLDFPIKSFSINSGSGGCYHYSNNEVIYERVDDKTFTTTAVNVYNYHDKERITFNNKVNSKQLLNILASINSNPAKIPSLKEFEITERDKKNYISLVDNQLKNKDTDYLSGKKKINKTFYYSVPKMLDTLNDAIIQHILDQHEGTWSTTRNWFTIQIVNQNNDTLNVSRKYYVNTLPWNLPWKCEYKGLNFNCYNIAFSRFINSCIPDDFMYKEVFDNRILIMQIADYLYNKP